MKRFWLAAWMLVLGFAGTAYAIPIQLIQNGSFDIGAPVSPCFMFALPAGSTAIPGWTVSVGDVDWVGPCNWPAQDGTHSLDLLGNGNIGGVQQTFATITGATYQVSFQLAGNPGPIAGNSPIKPLRVTVAGVTQDYTFDVTGIGLTNLQWTPKTFTFVASASTSTINFVSDMTGGAGFAGAALDNVRIVQIAPSTGPWTGRIGSATYSGADSVVNPGNGPTYNHDIGSPPGYPPYPGNPIGSSPNLVSDGTATGIAQFTYGATVDTDGGASLDCCHTGIWTLETIATTSGDVPLNWLYSGYHGTCNARASLTAFIRRGGSVIYTNTVYSAFDVNCLGNAPNGGFNQQGQVVVPGVVVGDNYGFMMHASNYDANGGVSGRLTVTASPSTMSTTTITSSTNPATFGSNVTFTANVAGSNPTGTVTFTDGGVNIASCSTVALVGGGNTRTAICPTSSLAVGNHGIAASYSGDFANAGSVSNPFTQVINPNVTVSGAPTIGNAQAGNAQASVTFAPPISNGGSLITFYTATSSPAGITGSCSAPCTSINVNGLSNGTAYTFTVRATNAIGTSAPSSASNSVTPKALSPSLIRAIEDTSGSFATVIGRVDGAPLGASVQTFIAATCNGGVPGGSVTTVGSSVAPNGDGYVVATPPGVGSAQFVALQLMQGVTPISDLSACLPSLGNNDFWTTALLVGANNAASGSSSANDYIDAPGKARWYKFKVAPGQRISVSLTGAPPNALPADYDLAVFKDIGAAFLAQILPADSAALTKLSAEFAPSTFSPSTFSPSTFSPSTFSPSTFSADAFAPSTFSPSTFSPSTFSPSTFSPEIISTAFSSAQTRSIIGVSATAGTTDESVVVDSWNNSGYFYARVTGRGDAFSTSGQLQLSVTKSASSCTAVTDTTLTSRSPVAGSGIVTVILTDTSSFAGSTTSDMALMNGNLAALASSTGGVIVDVAAAGYGRVQTLKTQAIQNPDCPFATNLVAEEIKGVVDSYRQNNPGLRFVVIAGGDDVIPFFRYPDQTLLGQESDYVPPVIGVSDASLRGNFVLSQDAYGSKTRISLRTSDYPVPGLAVGRLVKTPTEIAGMIDAALPYLTTTTVPGAVQPASSLVTGYDFLADVAGAVATELQSGTGAVPDQLIAPNNISPQDPASWHASDLAAKLFGSRHDVVFLAGHFSANSALAADFATNLITSDLTASKTDFTNSIVFSAGCHSGYSIVNRDALSSVTFTLDWAQAFAQKKATLIAGTGYQYGDTDFIEYSERLYLNFARELRAGQGAVAIGQALVNAKIDYLAATPDIRGIHTKALLEATLYGLPMLGVNMPALAGRGGPAALGAATPAITPTAVSTLPASNLGLRVADLALNAANGLATTMHTQRLTGANKFDVVTDATWLSGTDGVVSNPSEPALPLKVVNATPTDGTVLRGVGFRGGSYQDSLIFPLTGAPATEIRGVHVPFAAPNFFPNRPWTANYFGALAGNGATSLLVTPAQHRGADTVNGVLRSTLRQFSALNLRLYYSGNLAQASLSDAPTIVKVDAVPVAAGSVLFTAQVTGDPAAAIHQVWVTYTNGGGTWVPVDLVQCVGTTLPAACGTTADSQIWKGVATVGGNLQYIVQAASGFGLVSFDDNRGAYYAFSNAFSSTTAQAAAAAATALTIESVPMSAKYGDSVSVGARLMSGGLPVVGGLVNINIGGAGNTGVTGSDGRVTVNATVSNAPGSSTPISASYAGSGTALLASSATTSFIVGQAPASLMPLPSGVGVTVTAPVVTAGRTTQQPLARQSVSYLFTSTTTAGFTKTLVINTDNDGKATVPTAGLPVGTYSVTASFLPAALAGEATYYAGTTLVLPQQFTMNAQSIAFTAPTPSPTTPISAPSGSFAVAAAVTGPSAGQPVAITSTTPNVCTATGDPTANQAYYTVTILRGGADCLLGADTSGNNNYAPASAAATISIVKAAQTITSLTAPATITYAPPGTFTGSATAATPNSDQAVTITSATPSVCAVADAAVTNGATYTATLVAGDMSCVINADLSENNYYTAAHAQVTVPIVKATQAITIVGLSSDCTSPVKTYGNPSFGVSVTGSVSGIPVIVTSTAPGVCSVSYSAGTATLGIDGAGTCRISANQASNSLYRAAPTVNQCFTVAQAGQIIANFATIAPKTFGVDAPFVVSPSATSSAGFPVTLSAAGKCTINTATPPATVTLTGAGVCTITAAAPGNANYAPVSPAQTFNIAGTPQTITFAIPGDKALGTPVFSLTASATSGLPVTFAVQGTTDVCTLQPNGVTLKLLSPGVCTVTASQSGANSNYAAAADKVQSFKVYLSGVAGLASVTTSGSNALIDSFDSTPGLGGYAATKGALVNVLSNGTINVQGQVWGNVQSATANVVLSTGSLVTGNVTAATTISNSGSVGGTIAANQPLPTIGAPAITACAPLRPVTPSGWISGNYTYNAATGDLSVSGQNTVTLTGGSYCLNSITLSGGSTLTVNGPVKITLRGAFSASGNSVLNPTLIPRNLQIATSYTGSNGVTMSGNASGYFTVYAPGTSVSLTGNAQLFGAAVGKSFTGSGNPQLHYDVKTLDVWGSIFGL